MALQRATRGHEGLLARRLHLRLAEPYAQHVGLRVAHKDTTLLQVFAEAIVELNRLLVAAAFEWNVKWTIGPRVQRERIDLREC